MDEITELIQSTLADRYVLGLLDLQEVIAFKQLLLIHPALRHEVLQASLFVAQTDGALPPPEILRQYRLEKGTRLLPESDARIPVVEPQGTYGEKNEDILLHHVSPLFITEHKYLKIAFWSFVILTISLLITTLSFYIVLNW